MIKKEIIEKDIKEHLVYDISLDGTFVNALGRNILSNTDGFNFQAPLDSHIVEIGKQPYIVPREKGDSEIFNEEMVFCVKNLSTKDAVNMSIKDIIDSNEDMEILTIDGWVNKTEFVFIET